jgi:type IV pilus assembly protein PilV
MGMKIGLSQCVEQYRETVTVFMWLGMKHPKDGANTNDCTKNGSYGLDTKCIVLEAY